MHLGKKTIKKRLLVSTAGADVAQEISFYQFQVELFSTERTVKTEEKALTKVILP